MFEQTFENIDDILHKDAGCGSELDYVEQTSWILFLKYLEDLEKDRATAAELTGKTYTPSLISHINGQFGLHLKSKTETGLSKLTITPSLATISPTL